LAISQRGLRQATLIVLFVLPLLNLYIAIVSFERNQINKARWVLAQYQAIKEKDNLVWFRKYKKVVTRPLQIEKWIVVW
jgi:hypothetical protein